MNSLLFVAAVVAREGVVVVAREGVGVWGFGFRARVAAIGASRGRDEVRDSAVSGRVS